MTTSDILVLLKINLQLSVTAYDALLRKYIDSAIEAIKREGITLSESQPGWYSTEDAMLIESYAAYLFRSRDQDKGMPRSLRYLLNNRLFSEKAR